MAKDDKPKIEDVAKAWGGIVGNAARRTETLRQQIREDSRRGPRFVQIEDLDD